MQEQEINESLDQVFVLFEEGEIKPIELVWSGRKYKVERINSSWIERTKSPKSLGFSVVVDSGEIFQISYALSETTWTIDFLLTE